APGRRWIQPRAALLPAHRRWAVRPRLRFHPQAPGGRPMSATTSIRFTGVTPSAHTGTDHRPGLGRLTAVELRKMVNTRSGFWVPIGVGVATLAASLVASADHGGHAATLTRVLHAAA